MKTNLVFAREGSRVLRSRGLLLVCLVGLTVPVMGIDLPSPGRVVREVRGAVHRVANKVEGVARKAVPVDRHYDRDDRAGTSKRQLVTPGSPNDPATITPVEPSTIVVEPAPPSPVVEGAPKTPESLRQPAPLPAPEEPVLQPEGNAPRVPPSEPVASSRREAPVVDPAPLPEQASGSPTGQSKQTVDKAKPQGPPVAAAEVARPVPGKPGLVYAPGSKETAEDMIDVRGFESGQPVRDPRTGKIFRVP